MLAVQVARGDMPYQQFKADFVDIGRRAEMEARAVIEKMDGQQDGSSSGSESDRDVQHTVEVTEVCLLHLLPPQNDALLSWRVCADAATAWGRPGDPDLSGCGQTIGRTDACAGGAGVCAGRCHRHPGIHPLGGGRQAGRGRLLAAGPGSDPLAAQVGQGPQGEAALSFRRSGMAPVLHVCSGTADVACTITLSRTSCACGSRSGAGLPLQVVTFAGGPCSMAGVCVCACVRACVRAHQRGVRQSCCAGDRGGAALPAEAEGIPPAPAALPAGSGFAVRYEAHRGATCT